MTLRPAVDSVKAFRGIDYFGATLLRQSARWQSLTRARPVANRSLGRRDSAVT